MDIGVSQVFGQVPIMVMTLNGDLDGSNFQDVIAKAKEIHDAGARYLLLDMRGVPFMSSAGIIALHSAALLMRGDPPPDPEEGWAAFHAVSHDLESGVQPYVKLLAPQPGVTRVLEKTGMNRFFEIHAEREQAVASFQA